MKRTIRVASACFAAICIISLSVCIDSARAVKFPITYEGTVQVKASFPHGSCQGDAKMKITLYADGRLQETTDAIIIENATGCEIASIDSMQQPWRVHQGTHDKAGSFSLKMAYVTVTGTFGDQQISGTGTFSDAYMTETYTFTLFVQGSAQNRQPEIALSPADYPFFQLNVLMNNGFTIAIRDEDGLQDSTGNWKIDWGTLRLTMDGIDITGHFLDKITKNNIFSVETTSKELRLHITPDPVKFMVEHDVFFILKNGTHIIELSICDTGKLCGRSAYSIYFGPFILTGPVDHQNCDVTLTPDQPLSWGNYFTPDFLVLGNTGLDYGKNALFFVLMNTAQELEASFQFDTRRVPFHGLTPNQEALVRLGLNGWRDTIVPVFDSQSIPTGHLEYILKTDLTQDSALRATGLFATNPRLHGPLKLYSTVIDQEDQAYQLGIIDFTLCPGN